ncbi:hypothetical protein HDU83_008160, partial [Entophlyctis luteolus]
MFGDILTMDSESTLALDLLRSKGESMGMWRGENQSQSETFSSLEPYAENSKQNGFVHVFNSDTHSIFEESASILDDL